MTTTRKRLISLLLTFVMIFSLLPAPAFAEEVEDAASAAVEETVKTSEPAPEAVSDTETEPEEAPASDPEQPS